MKEGKKINLYIVFGFLIILIYMLLAIKPLKKELCFEPEKTIVLSELVGEQPFFKDAGKKPTFCFRLAKYAGYLTEDAEPVFVAQYPYKAALSDSVWTFYNNDSESVSVQNIDGSLKTVLGTAGFPFFQNDRLFVFLPNGNAVKEFEYFGREKWVYENYAPITAFNSSESECVMGFADGELVCLDSYGRQNFSFYPHGSSKEVILGADINSKQKLVACVCGIDKQRFILSSYANDQQKVIFHEYLNGNIRQPVFVKFGKIRNVVYFQCQDGLGIADCKKFKVSIIPMEETIRQVEEIENLGITLVLAEKDNNWIVYLFENAEYRVGYLPFTAESAFINAVDDGFFLGKDDSVSKIKITYK